VEDPDLRRPRVQGFNHVQAGSPSKGDSQSDGAVEDYSLQGPQEVSRAEALRLLSSTLYYSTSNS